MIAAFMRTRFVFRSWDELIDLRCYGRQHSGMVRHGVVLVKRGILQKYDPCHQDVCIVGSDGKLWSWLSPV